MSKKQFNLSSLGLKNIIFTSNTDEEQFAFIFGDKKIQMNRILAEFISPRVSHIHQTDPTIDRIQLISPGNKNDKSFLLTSDFFVAFEKISKGEKIDLDREMSDKLRYLSICLDNDELYSEMNALFPIEYDEQKIGLYLNYLDGFDKEFFINKTFFKENIIDFLASHFYLIDKSKLMKLDKRTLYLIIFNENLKLNDEDSLLEFIDHIYTNEENENQFPSEMDFYESIKISELSDNKKIQFISNIKSNQINNQLWMNIQNFLLDNINGQSENIDSKRYIKSKIEEKKNHEKNSIEVLYSNNPNERFKGIISKLGNGIAKNALRNGLIDITCSSVWNSDNKVQAKNVVEYENDRNVFESKILENSWLCIDFIKNKIKPSHYSIKSTDYGANICSPINWCIEGSNDNVVWKELDSRSNEQSLRENCAANTFDIKKNLKNDEYYRFLRIKTTGVNASGDHRLFFSSIEFFGSIKSS